MRRVNVPSSPACMDIYGRLGSGVGGLQCNSTRQSVCLKWLSFISWTLPRAWNSGNCFAATIQAYQSVFIDSSCHCLAATKNPNSKPGHLVDLLNPISWPIMSNMCQRRLFLRQATGFKNTRPKWNALNISWNQSLKNEYVKLLANHKGNCQRDRWRAQKLAKVVAMDGSDAKSEITTGSWGSSLDWWSARQTLG